jgi:hypothetical protein
MSLSDKDLNNYVSNVGGLYDSSDVFVAIRPKKTFILLILVHEYCHFCQELDERNKVKVNFKHVSGDEYSIFWNWLKDKKVKCNKKKIKDIARRIASIELDCDQRVVSLMKEYELEKEKGYSVKNYVQRANSYAMFYQFAAKYRTWYNKSTPYVENLVKMMPCDKFITSSTKMTKEFELYCLNNLI